MELMIQWFWFIKLSITLFTIWVCYKAFIVNKFNSKTWNILAGVVIILAIIQPFKLDVDTKSQTQYANNQIEKSKVLPRKNEDNSFKEANKLDGKLPTTLMGGNVPVIVNTK